MANKVTEQELNRIETFITYRKWGKMPLEEKTFNYYNDFYNRFFVSAVSADQLFEQIQNWPKFDHGMLGTRKGKFESLLTQDLINNGWNKTKDWGSIGSPELNRLDLYCQLKIDNALRSLGATDNDYTYVDFYNKFFRDQISFNNFLGLLYVHYSKYAAVDFFSDTGLKRTPPPPGFGEKIKDVVKDIYNDGKKVVDDVTKQIKDTPKQPVAPVQQQTESGNNIVLSKDFNFGLNPKSSQRQKFFEFAKKYGTLPPNIATYNEFFSTYFSTAEKAKASYVTYLDLVNKINDGKILGAIPPGKYYQLYYSDLGLVDIKDPQYWIKLIPDDIRPIKTPVQGQINEIKSLFVRSDKVL